MWKSAESLGLNLILVYICWMCTNITRTDALLVLRTNPNRKINMSRLSLGIIMFDMGLKIQCISIQYTQKLRKGKGSDICSCCVHCIKSRGVVVPGGPALKNNTQINMCCTYTLASHSYSLLVPYLCWGRFNSRAVYTSALKCSKYLPIYSMSAIYFYKISSDLPYGFCV